MTVVEGVSTAAIEATIFVPGKSFFARASQFRSSPRLYIP